VIENRKRSICHGKRKGEGGKRTRGKKASILFKTREEGEKGGGCDLVAPSTEGFHKKIILRGGKIQGERLLGLDPKHRPLSGDGRKKKVSCVQKQGPKEERENNTHSPPTEKKKYLKENGLLLQPQPAYIDKGEKEKKKGKKKVSELRGEKQP